MLLGWTFASFSKLVLCLCMQNFTPTSSLALDSYSLDASMSFPFSAQNGWHPIQATAGPYQQQGPHQPQGQSWNAMQLNSIYFQPLIQSQQNQYPQFNVINPTTAPIYQAQQPSGWSPSTYQNWQQLEPVGFVALPDTALASEAFLASHHLAPPACAVAFQAPLAQQRSYASVAVAKASEAISGQGRDSEILFSVSLNAAQAVRMVKRACRWQDSNFPGMMIAKDGEQLTQ